MNTLKQISIRFTHSDYEKIEKCIQRGYAMNVVDFVRQAARDKCRELGIEIEPEKGTQVVFGG
jgi:Arc/MetJ-type ribon-helix-helix transcriptional regulator